MKLRTTLFLLICSLPLFSQSDSPAGDYYLQIGDKAIHWIEYKLTLNQDGTFLFHSYTNHKNGIPWEENKYGKGNWSADGTVVSFFTDKEKDLDQQDVLDFRNSKAHYITKPARDKTDRVIKSRLTFFKSGIFWIKGLDIFKL